jgi:hypothetical protein
MYTLLISWILYIELLNSPVNTLKLQQNNLKQRLKLSSMLQIIYFKSFRLLLFEPLIMTRTESRNM